MATSGTTDFNLEIDEIIEEALERAGIGGARTGYHLRSAIKHSPEKTEQLRLFYEDELQRALTEDGQRTSLFISPQTFYGDGV